MVFSRRFTVMIVALILGLATALIVGGTSPQSVSAQNSEDNGYEKIEQIPTTSNGEVRLSEKEQAEFARGAKQVSGLSETEIERAMEDPKVFAGIPTSAEPSSEVTYSAAGYARYCKTRRGETRSASIDYRNGFGNLLHRYRIKKRWCYNGRRVTSIKFIVDRSFVTNLGNITGWKYRGIKRKQNNYFYAFGNSRGGHRSYRRAFFEQCVLLKSGFTCGVRTTRPVIVQRSYGNEAYRWRWSSN